MSDGTFYVGIVLMFIGFPFRLWMLATYRDESSPMWPWTTYLAISGLGLLLLLVATVSIRFELPS